MQRELVLAIFSAALGTVLGFFVQQFDVSSYSDWIIASLLTLLVIISLAMIGPLWLVLRSPGKIDIAGEWNTTWHYEKSNVLVNIDTSLSLTQYGRYLKGEGKSVSISGPFPFRSLQFKINGQIHLDGTIEGKWWNCDRGRRYHGFFQGKLSLSGNSFNAQWIGIENQGVRSGLWKWDRPK